MLVSNIMKKIITISVLIVSISNTIFGCSCYMVNSFDLSDFDESINIAEIKVLEKLKGDYEIRLAQYKIDTTNWDKEYPPPPLRPPDDYSEFQIEVIEIFKGSLNLSIIELRATGKYSSCYWEPEVGKTYIFYFGELLTERDNEIVEIGGCQRRIRNDSKNFNSEVEALKTFKEKRSGKFEIDQSDLINDLDRPYISIRGRFKKGKRFGRWIIAEPIIYSKDIKQPRKKLLVLRYKDGNLISIKFFEPNNAQMNNYILRRWKYYYEEKKL